MISAIGFCSCQQINFTLKLPLPLTNYSPRECDCDFCLTRHISYLSDPLGSLEIISPSPLNIMSQGSAQAMFLTCPHCNDVIAASYQSLTGLIGAINSRLLVEKDQLLKPIKVSPRLLSATEKVKRWQEMWLTIFVNGKANIK